MGLSQEQPVDVADFAEAATFPPAFIEREEPAVLRRFIRDWPAVDAAKDSDKALVDYLLRFASDDPVTVYAGKADEPSGHIGYNSTYTDFTFDRARAPLADILKSLLDGSERALYIGSTRVEQWLSGFSSDNRVSFPTKQPVANFWIGNQTIIAAHCDTPKNLACCVSGRRTFTLFPPDQIENLYPGPVDLNPSGRAISLVDFDRPDFEKFPRFKKALANAVEVVLEPGDAIYIPPLWWHRVRSESPINMLVNYWWNDTPAHMGIPDLALEHAILALRGLPDSQKKAWKAFFDYYIFAEQEKALDHIPEHIRGMLDPDDSRAAQRGWLNFSDKLHR